MSENDIFDMNGVFNIDPPQEEPKGKTGDSYEQLRSSWTDRIKKMSAKIENMRNLADLEVDAFSSRGDAVEEKHNYISMLTNLNKTYKVLEADKLKEITLSGKKYTAAQTSTVVAANLSDLWAQIEHLKSHVDFMEETVKSIDNIIYGIKYRIEIQKYLDPTR